VDETTPHSPETATVPQVATEPAFWGIRRRALDVLERAHLAHPAVRLYEDALAAASHLRAGRMEASDGLPLPPARLRAQIGPRHADAEFFLRSGREQAEIVRTLVHEDGSALEDFASLLDWGCGCGRILRNWSQLPHTRVSGCDINPKMVDWCNRNLPFADVVINELSPPLPYPDSTFDIVYAFSVMTHLNEELQRAWSRECFRVLKTGGYFLFSTMGEHYLSRGRLNEDERRRFEAGKVVVLYDEAPGTSLCSAYHPPEYVRERLAAEFDFVSFRPAIDYGRHDVHLFRKP
jgi:SAM-dependent methyltransferase